MVTLAENPRTAYGCRRAPRAWSFLAASVSSTASAVNFTDQRSRITDQQFGDSDDLFIDRRSLVIERSADAHGSTRLATNAAGGVVETMNYL